MTPPQPRHWYLAKNKQRLGPFTAEQLRQMAATGMIQPADMVLEEGKQKWHPLSDLQFPSLPLRKNYTRAKLLGVAAVAGVMLMVIGLWSVGAFRPKKGSLNPTQQAEVIINTEPVEQASQDDSPKPTAEREKTESVHIRRFWRFAPEYGDGYFKLLPDGTWEERGKGDRALMGIWVERGRTSEYVELEDRKRGYLTRLGAGKAWIASIRDGIFRPSPHGNWENGPRELTTAEKPPLNEKPQVEKPAEKRTSPPIELSDLVKLGKALAKAKQDEFYLSDLNKSGIHSFFSAANLQVTSQVGDAQIVEYKMCITETKYDFDAKSFNVIASRWITITHHPTSYGVLLPDYYLAFSIPAQADEAREWSQMFKQKKLTLDVTFRVRGFRKVSQPDTSRGTLMNDVVETTVITARLGSTK